MALKSKISKVAVYDCDYTHYDNTRYYSPSQAYVEMLPDIAIKSDDKIYDFVRKTFILMGLDSSRINTKEWNPFSDFISKGDSVVIKPNFVNHLNHSKNGNLESVVTNIAIIRPVIDYVVLALGGTGKIILGDAPVQDCDFVKLMQISGVDEMIREYKKHSVDIGLVDFRKNSSDISCATIDMGKDSKFNVKNLPQGKYAITNYDLKIMGTHHKGDSHKYIIPEYVIQSDVIINLPKPKTHKKAGVTASMKNFIGMNASKECLPHHRSGPTSRGGDEYPEDSILKDINSKLQRQTFRKNIILTFILRVSNFIMSRLLHQNRFREGSWYGNDTIWRTILDINKLIMFVDKNGKIKTSPQRTIFNLADMIISGDHEGPLAPDNYEAGYIVAGFNQFAVDRTIVSLMGFDAEKIKYLNTKEGIPAEYKIFGEKIKCIDKYGKQIKDISKIAKKFEPSDGWRDYLKGDAELPEIGSVYE